MLMTALTAVEAHFGVTLPPGYRDWVRKKYTDHREGMDGYLWVHEAEWILPDEIAQYDLWRSNVTSKLIPFTFSGARDTWCWNTRVQNGHAEFDIVYCWRDEELADRFAPTFPTWFYRNCLNYASGAFDRDDDGIEEARKNLRVWSQRLSEIHPGDWADHLVELAQKQPSEYERPKMGASHDTMFGFVTVMKVDEIVVDQFGPEYVGQKVEWGA